MRITASWLGSLHPPNTRMWHEIFVHHTRAPLDVVIPTKPRADLAIDRRQPSVGRARVL
jgi:hypothetical protein